MKYLIHIWNKLIQNSTRNFSVWNMSLTYQMQPSQMKISHNYEISLHILNWSNSHMKYFHMWNGMWTFCKGLHLQRLVITNPTSKIPSLRNRLSVKNTNHNKPFVSIHDKFFCFKMVSQQRQFQSYSCAVYPRFPHSQPKTFKFNQSCRYPVVKLHNSTKILYEKKNKKFRAWFVYLAPLTSLNDCRFYLFFLQQFCESKFFHPKKFFKM